MIQVLDLLVYPFCVPNLTYLKELIKWRIDPKDVKYHWMTNSIYLKKIHCESSSRENFFLLHGINLINDLVDDCDIRVSIDGDGKVNVKIQNFDFLINTWEELHIIHEIFYKGIYNVHIKEEFVFVDIGMNVAMASLFMASKSNVLDVYAYEPFEETFALGMSNIDRNRLYASKIHAYNYGVGARSEELVLDYLPEFKGSVGVKGIPARVRNNENEKSIRKQKIILRGIDEILHEIRTKHEGVKLVTKIDCEGSEYEILRSLSANGLLNALEVIMLEWHEEGPDEIIEMLTHHGFTCFSFDSCRKDIGTIYAVQHH